MIFRPSLLGLTRRRDEVLERARRVTGIAPVPRERRSGLTDLRRRRLEEARHLRMPLAPAGSRQEVVRDIPDQHVCKRELLIAFDRRHRLSVDQVSTFQRAEETREMFVVGEPAAPEHLPGHRGFEQERALVEGKSVEACSEDALDRRG